MISSEYQIVILILLLYASTCIVLVYADEGVARIGLTRMKVRIADQRWRIAGRSIIWLNPLTPALPTFRCRWGHVDAMFLCPGLPSRMPETITACKLMAPYALAVFVFGVLGIPAALLFANAYVALPVAALAYLAVLSLLARLWFSRSAFSLSGKEFALLAFESVACMPLAAGMVRRLSLLVRIDEDLASLLPDLPDSQRIDSVQELLRRCNDLIDCYESGSADLARLAQYRLALSRMAVPEPAEDSDPCDAASHPARMRNQQEA